MSRLYVLHIGQTEEPESVFLILLFTSQITTATAKKDVMPQRTRKGNQGTTNKDALPYSVLPVCSHFRLG